MTSLKEALDLEQNRLFVGRETEIAYFEMWLAQHTALTEVVFLLGMGGIGKSALLLKFLHMAQREQALCIWLDGRACTATPAGFLESLRTYLFQKKDDPLPKTSMTELAAYLSRQRTVLCIDNYEQLQHIDSWLREVFFPELSATGILIVLAARQDMAFGWQNNMAWGSRVKRMQLSPIQRQEAHQYYAEMGMNNPSEVERLIDETKGLPLAMALAAERVQSHASEHASWPISSLVSAEILRETATSDLQEILDLLCILPQAKAELLNRLLNEPLTAQQLHHISRLSFVRPTMDGFALHDVARAHLLEDFLRRDPDGYQLLRLRIVEDAVRALKKVNTTEKRRISMDLLSLCRDSFKLGAIPLVPLDPLSVVIDSFRSDDLPHLHRLITEEGLMPISLESEDKLHELLNALAEHFPESIHIFRSADGIPLAFNAGLLLYRETCVLLEAYMPQVLDCCLPLEAQHLKQLLLEDADTCFQLLSAATSQDASYTYYELKGILISDGLSRHSAIGTNSILVSNLSELNVLLQSMGCQARLLLDLPMDHPSYGATMYELDLRASDIGESIIGLLRASFDDHIVNSEVVLTEEDIRAALALLSNTAALGRSELARKLNRSGPALQLKLQSILDLNPPPYPLNNGKQALLKLLSEEPDLSVEAAAERLYISRPTYFRHRSGAIGNLIQLLSG